MYPVYDDDAALLLSLTVAAKRRPAALDEIITALAMAQHGEIPAKSVSHREHRDHRGKTNGYREVAVHLSGEPAKLGETFSFSVNSVA